MRAAAQSATISSKTARESAVNPVLVASASSSSPVIGRATPEEAPPPPKENGEAPSSSSSPENTIMSPSPPTTIAEIAAPIAPSISSLTPLSWIVPLNASPPRPMLTSVCGGVASSPSSARSASESRASSAAICSRAAFTRSSFGLLSSEPPKLNMFASPRSASRVSAASTALSKSGRAD